MGGAITCCHAAPYVHATWPTHVHVRAHLCACVHVCVCEISGLSILIRIFSKPTNHLYLYTRDFALIFIMWEYVCLFNCASDVVRSQVFD